MKITRIFGWSGRAASDPDCRRGLCSSTTGSCTCRIHGTSSRPSTPSPATSAGSTGATGRTIPAPGEPGDESWGGVPFEDRKHVGAWMVPSYDPDLNLVYIGTSVISPAPKFLIGGADLKHLYHSSTLALDADTGESSGTRFSAGRRCRSVQCLQGFSFGPGHDPSTPNLSSYPTEIGSRFPVVRWPAWVTPHYVSLLWWRSSPACLEPCSPSSWAIGWTRGRSRGTCFDGSRGIATPSWIAAFPSSPTLNHG